MNGNRFLLDTNIILYVMGEKIDILALPEGEFYISFVTELELLSYPSLSTQEEQRIKKLLSEIPIIDIYQKIKDQTIQFRRRHQLKLPDAIIVATALFLNATLITNDMGLQSIREIRVQSITTT